MNDLELEDLKSNDLERQKAILAAFNEKYASLFDFAEFNANGLWIKDWNAIFGVIRNPATNAEILSECLCCVRILTRNKERVKSLDLHADFDCLLKLANLCADRVPDKEIGSPAAIATTIEALKCLCNIVFLSEQCQQLCTRNATTAGILKRVSSPTTFPYEIEYYDMKLLFLITAFEPLARTKVRDDLNGMTYLTEWLDLKMKAENKSDKQIELICEILKVMFNITANPDKTPNGNENEIQYRRLTAVVRSLLLDFGGMTTEKEKSVVLNCINLLNNISIVCQSELLRKPDTSRPDDVVFEEKCVRAPEVILNFLKTVLSDVQSNPGNIEQIPPVLTVLLKCARSTPVMRHYIRSVVLPPLKDVSQRPEVGSELRNHLCRFLTLPNVVLRDLSADLLFVLCKENVGRMIKYTGYGNAAGLFATKGILDCRRVENADYSSDSEDSDTEEYKEQQHGINPVLGCYEPPRKNPLEGMSEEQKEYEAMQLANLMDKLHRSGVVQPCRIGEDGKPQPVDHILQLQEELPQQQLEQKRKT